MKQSHLLIIGVIVLAVIGGGVLLSMQGNGGTPEDSSMEKTITVSPSPAALLEATGASGVGDAMAAEKTFTVTGSNYAFDLKEMKVKKGDKVTITFKNADGMHDLKIDEFNVATKQLASGAEETVSFVADQAGTFEYYCSVGKHRANGMFGKLIVE